MSPTQTKSISSIADVIDIMIADAESLQDLPSAELFGQKNAVRMRKYILKAANYLAKANVLNELTLNTNNIKRKRSDSFVDQPVQILNIPRKRNQPKIIDLTNESDEESEVVFSTVALQSPRVILDSDDDTISEISDQTAIQEENEMSVTFSILDEVFTEDLENMSCHAWIFN